MKYFFALGTHPSLSLAEIIGLFPEAKSGRLVSGGVFIWETSQTIQAEHLIKRLGGTIKIGVLEADLSNRDQTSIIKQALTTLTKTVGEQEGKVLYGLSLYGQSKLNTKQIGMEIKKGLKEAGKNCRWVISKDKILSSVVVEQNKLIQKGAELVLLTANERIFLGRTLAVQDFKGLSYRDFSRPARDDLSGMLPPKLAQIMLNLANPADDAVILDPFCGSGTVAMEAALMGYQNIIGSDISDKAISDSQTNFAWLLEKFSVRPSDNVHFFQTDVSNLSRSFSPDYVDVIITEPYLGPQRGQHDPRAIKRELENLYAQALRQFAKVLKEDGQVVMIWPIFKTNPDLLLDKGILGDTWTIVDPLAGAQEKILRKTARNTLVYGREGQKVWREIVVLKKNTRLK